MGPEHPEPTVAGSPPSIPQEPVATEGFDALLCARPLLLATAAAHGLAAGQAP
jgi:hypothetical protein